VTLAEARRLADFPIRLPTVGGYDAPDAVYFRGDVPGGVVFFVYGPARAPHALLSEFESTRVEARKIVGPGTPVEKVDVNGEPGYWFSGRPHIFVFFNRQGTFQFGTFRLATNTLVWRRGTLTYRLEAKVSQDHAVRIAESIP
jgi:hypothetical protein